MDLGRLILVTDRGQADGRDLIDVVDAALAALPPASAIVQLREKDLVPRDLYALARRLLEVTHRHRCPLLCNDRHDGARRRLLEVTSRPRCPLLVNDRMDVALAAGADGVHLPEKGLPIAVARRL